MSPLSPSQEGCSELQHDIDLETEDVPVNKTTTFNGRLNQFMHSVNKPTESSIKPANLKRQRTDTSISESLSTTTNITHPPSTTRTTRSRSSSTTSTVINTSPTKKARRRKSSPPSTPSTAADSLLRDTIPANLTLLLVGVNPGTLTGTTGYSYAHPSNLFWKLLHASGITPIRHPPSDTYKLPTLYNIGNTNIVARPTRDASMLTRAEMDAGVPILEAKIAAQRPEAVCLVGKSIWEAIWRVRHGRAIRKEQFRYGWQDDAENMGRVTGSSEWGGAPVFVATTTSALAAGMSFAQKEAVWAELGSWVVKRRVQRSSVAGGLGTRLDEHLHAGVEDGI
ncbi:DNA glycosylase [Penicillium manginii]|uniref:DNA glycosylase n=1 Tax=Penicillium manginii TaxID=203109 RepID=UPI002547C5E8|nr:DNA glycosylase [Penicillium manginii]KAJ5744167.1 DNA glycosylase [Penicillium manginii]